MSRESPTIVSLPRLLDVEIRVMYHEPKERPWHFGVVYAHVLRANRLDRLFNSHRIDRLGRNRDVACDYTLRDIPPAAMTHTAALLKGTSC